MPSDSPRLRIIQEHEQFLLEKSRISFDDRDADRIYQNAVYWPLARNPESGHRTRTPGIWVFSFEPAEGVSYAVYYQFNADIVLLLSIVPARQSYNPLYD